MLDVSKAKRKRIVIPAVVKFLFLLLPWFFVAYGISALQHYLEFYNNSVPAKAEVVLLAPSEMPVDPVKARALTQPDSVWFRPAFLYQHENGLHYVGGAITESINWKYTPGEQVDISYNRVNTSEAQPVTLLKFWWGPGSFIGGGLLSFIALAVAFWLAGRPPRDRKKKRKRNRALQLRRN